MYHEWATDPKIQMLSEADQRRFVMVLCFRCCNGDVTLHDEEVAFQLRVSIDEWMQTKTVLLDKNLINEDNTPTNWDKRQFASDSSKSRVAAHRERKKKERNKGVTLHETKSNALDTDTDTDTENSNASKAFDGFEEFWKVVHRKVAKVKAKKAFANAVKRVAKQTNAPPRKIAERIIEKMKLFAESKQASHEVKGKLHPSTWLNEGRYEDDVSVWNESDGGPEEVTVDDLKANEERLLAIRERQKIEARKKMAVSQ